MVADATLEFDRLPAIAPLYARAVLKRGSGLSAGRTIPAINARLARTEVRAESLARYRRVCGFERRDYLPVTYPHVLAFPLHMAVLTHSHFPLGLLGLVHVRNRIVAHRPVAADARLDIRVSVAGHRDVPRGIEFDLSTTVAEAGGAVCWEETSVMLSRQKHSERDRSVSRGTNEGARPAESVPFEADSESRWDVPGDIGRRYAAVAGDYNPIHLSAWTARLFGFPRAIATGMWTVARVAAALDVEHVPAIGAFSVVFRRPLLLPGTAVFRQKRHETGVDFAVVAGDRSVTHLTGAFRRRSTTVADGPPPDSQESETHAHS